MKTIEQIDAQIAELQAEREALTNTTGMPRKGECYWTADGGVFVQTWDGGRIDLYRFKHGLVFSTKEAADVCCEKVRNMNEQKEKTMNQIIHEWMGKHWHVHPDPNDPEDSHCECGMDARYFGVENLAYDSESSPRKLLAEVEAKVIETFGRKEYHDAILDVIFETWPVYELPMDVAFAGAKERSQAIVALIQEDL